MQIVGLKFVAIESENADELAEFARSVLGLEGDTVEGRHVFELRDGSTLAFLPLAFLADSPDTVVGLVVEDFDGAMEECRAHGVEFSGPVLGEQARYQHFRLPDGRYFALIEKSSGKPAQ